MPLGPYRHPAKISPPDEVLEYFPEKPRVDSSLAAWWILITPILALAAAGAILPEWSWPLVAAAALFFWLRQRRLRKLPHAILRIEERRLRISNARGKVIHDLPLDDLLDVCLDTKTIQKVQEGLDAGIAHTRFINATVGPSIDTSRIELVTTGGPVTLTDHHTSNIDATGWFSKIRRFLRKNGWTPSSERRDAEAAARPANPRNKRKST